MTEQNPDLRIPEPVPDPKPDEAPALDAATTPDRTISCSPPSGNACKSES